MRKSVAVVFALVLGWAAPAAALDADMARSIIADAADRSIMPGYFDLRAETTRLSEDLDAFCKAPSEDGLTDVRDQFARAVNAWSRAELVRFGPVMDKNRMERILYWPDRKSIGLKQVQELLATKDPTATNVGTLVQKSVAMQGFGALEFVLFGTGAEALLPGDAYRCAYGKAIAANLRARATEIEQGWMHSFLDQWQQPGANNQRYRSVDESLLEVFNTLIHGLEMVRDVRINGFLGDEAKDDKPRQAIWWRSGHTVDSLMRNLDSLHRLFTDAGIARLLPDGSKWIAQSVEFEFGNADRALRELRGPIDDILKDPDKRAKLAYVRIVTSSLSELIGTRLTSELGLTAGFSSLDGD